MGRLYVSYPTPSGDDRIYRIDADGEIHTIVRGLGRAQGLAFDIEHNLYVVAYVEGRGGVVKITPAGDVQHVIAGVNLVGLAFGVEGELLLTDHSALYKLELGISGRPLL
jgi:sugar lactone lactonase YvrE